MLPLSNAGLMDPCFPFRFHSHRNKFLEFVEDFFECGLKGKKGIFIFFKIIYVNASVMFFGKWLLSFQFSESAVPHSILLSNNTKLINVRYCYN